VYDGCIYSSYSTLDTLVFFVCLFDFLVFLWLLSWHLGIKGAARTRDRVVSKPPSARARGGNRRIRRTNSAENENTHRETQHEKLKPQLENAEWRSIVGIGEDGLVDVFLLARRLSREPEWVVGGHTASRNGPAISFRGANSTESNTLELIPCRRLYSIAEARRTWPG